MGVKNATVHKGRKYGPYVWVVHIGLNSTDSVRAFISLTYCFTSAKLNKKKATYKLQQYKSHVYKKVAYIG